MTILRHTTALLAICAVLVITTVSVLPAHGHDAARSCDICHSGHLPCLQPSGEIQFHAQMPVIWHHAPEDFERYVHSSSVIRSPRAPPV